MSPNDKKVRHHPYRKSSNADGTRAVWQTFLECASDYSIPEEFLNTNETNEHYQAYLKSLQARDVPRWFRKYRRVLDLPASKSENHERIEIGLLRLYQMFHTSQQSHEPTPQQSDSRHSSRLDGQSVVYYPEEMPYSEATYEKKQRSNDDPIIISDDESAIQNLRLPGDPQDAFQANSRALDGFLEIGDIAAAEGIVKKLCGAADMRVAKLNLLKELTRRS